ncbi:MAG TPA: M15 family metallopeptidase [Terriglobales bacterium]|nr:M15 family metallopeptidase [Terriglobales bacterium]
MVTEQLVGVQSPEVVPPVGLSGVVREFGDVREFVGMDGCLNARWEAQYLAVVALPFSLMLAWDHSRIISSFRCHRRLTAIFGRVFERIVANGLASKVSSFGGCFMYRPKRTGAKLSTHSWGIAIDLNPETNGLGCAGDMDPGVVRVFRDFGFEWGGEWVSRARDPMHFQFCSHY